MRKAHWLRISDEADEKTGARSSLTYSDLISSLITQLTELRSSDTEKSPLKLNMGNFSLVRMRELDENYEIQEAIQVRLVKKDREVASVRIASPDSEWEAILEQAEALERMMPVLAQTYANRFVIFHNGRVLAEGATPEEAAGKLAEADRDLPAVLGYVTPERQEPEYMGGPKRG